MNKTISRIVVFMPRYLGDCINVTPSLRMLQEYYPESEIFLVIRQSWATLFEQSSQVKCLIDGRPNNKAKGYANLLSQLREIKADACILMTNTFFDALIVKLAGIPIRYGYDLEMRGFLLSHRLSMDRNRHYINRYAYLTNALCDESFEHLYPVSIYHDAQHSSLYQDKTLKIGICILNQAKISRHYPVVKTVQVVEQLSLAQPCINFFILGSLEEADVAQQVVSSSESKGVANIQSLAGKTSLLELVNDIAALDLLITVDSGPMHIAAATKTPTIALHGKGTSPFSLVCPKQDHILVISSRGRYIRDNDQILDILPDDITHAAIQIIEKIEKPVNLKIAESNS
jgi:heptosyltransferase-2